MSVTLCAFCSVSSNLFFVIQFYLFAVSLLIERSSGGRTIAETHSFSLALALCVYIELSSAVIQHTIILFPVNSSF